jgi:SEC-C motif domain protein
MRSRFSAFALERWDYLSDTQLGPFGGPPPTTRWIRLSVRRVEGGGPADAQGIVEFEAFSKVGRTRRRLHEISRFERKGGRWLYVDGEILFAGALKR